MLTRKYAVLSIFTVLLSGCVTSNYQVSNNSPIDTSYSQEYKHCLINIPEYLIKSEGVGITEQAATSSARTSLAQQIKINVKVEENLQVNKSDIVKTEFQSNASTQSEILLTNSIVLCKQTSVDFVRVVVGYDNRNLDVKLQSVLSNYNIRSTSQLRGSSLLINSSAFKYLDRSLVNKINDGKLPVSFSRKNDIWYLNIGSEVIALTPDELIKLTTFENVGEITLISRNGLVFKDSRLKNGDVFKIKYTQSSTENSYFSMFIQAQDGAISLLYDNLEFANGEIELPEIQACMAYDDVGGCQSLAASSKDKLIAVTSSSPIKTLQIEQMQHSYNQEQAVNRYQLPELIASLSEVKDVNITSAFVFVTPYKN